MAEGELAKVMVSLAKAQDDHQKLLHAVNICVKGGLQRKEVAAGRETVRSHGFVKGGFQRKVVAVDSRFVKAGSNRDVPHPLFY